MRLHVPLLSNIFGVLASYFLLIWCHAYLSESAFSIFWIILGMLYTNAFEYGYHRVLLHTRVPCLSFLGYMWLDHLEHHYAFSEKSTSRDPKDFENILTSWYVFALLLFFHYSVALFVMPHVSISSFFAGVTFQFLVLYQVNHWFTHVTDSWYDKALEKVMLIGTLRILQKEHHWDHHKRPDGKYSFGPPLQWFGF